MAIFPGYLLTEIIITRLLLLVFFINVIQSQFTPNVSSPPTMAECGPRLIPLAPCAPFVQGQSPGPTQQCCDNLIQVYNQQRGCLCLFLDGTALASLPINTSLALQLPGICSPQLDPSTCSPAGIDVFYRFYSLHIRTYEQFFIIVQKSSFFIAKMSNLHSILCDRRISVSCITIISGFIQEQSEFCLCRGTKCCSCTTA